MIHVCTDRLLHRDRARPHRVVGDRAISPVFKQWPNGRVLTVAFMGGTDAQRALVVQHAPKWSQHANLQLAFKDSLPADIRISFDPSDGAWSYVGTDCAEIPANQPTLNLGWQDQAVILHEVGHCLDGGTLIDCPRDLEKYPLGIPMRDLVGTQPWVYAWKAGHIVVRKASRVWLTKRAETVRVTLRPGKGKKATATYSPPQELVGTLDHPVLLSDGKTWKRLGDLRPGDRLCSLYRHKDKQRSSLKWTGASKSVAEHVFLCEEIYGERPARHDAHHANERMLDQRPENLQWKDQSAHMRDHALGRPVSNEARAKISASLKEAHASGALRPSQLGRSRSEEEKRKISATLSGRTLTEEHRTKIAAARIGFRFSAESRASMSASAKARTDQVRGESGCYLPAPNHVVASVEHAGVRDVYDMTVPDAESFVANGVVVHNSLGLLHEHQNPQGGIKWNRDAVIADLSGPPNYWSVAEIDHNVLDRYAANQIIGTEFDPASIMLYSFPSSWTTDGFSAPWNQAISAQDGAFVGSAKMYPKTGAPVELPLLPLCRARRCSPRARGELDEYRFVAPVAGQYVFEIAAGPDGAAVDTVLALWHGIQLIAQDDDSGRGLFSRIEAKIAAGEYRVSVRHHSASGTGKYRVIAWG